jgi:hypothetical protein
VRANNGHPLGYAAYATGTGIDADKWFVEHYE